MASHLKMFKINSRYFKSLISNSLLEINRNLLKHNSFTVKK